MSEGFWLKWTAPGRVPSYQGGAPLPEPGVWSEKIVDPVLCVRGFHACRWEDVLDHVSAELWVCELDGPIIEGDTKVVGSRIRLVEQVGVDWLGWMWDCLAHDWEEWVPRSAREAWQTMLDERTRVSCERAAGAAWAAGAAGAARAAQAAERAAGAAWAAGSARAAGAARAEWAAGSARAARAAWAAERRWQTDRLLTVHCSIEVYPVVSVVEVVEGTEHE